MKTSNLTTGSVARSTVTFALPYLLAAFLQTFYGMVDLYVVKLYNTTSTSAAVANGSQIMHMVTVVILGFAMGTTVHVGRCVGQKDKKGMSGIIGTSILLFSLFAIVFCGIAVLGNRGIVTLLRVPAPAVEETVQYLHICFLGIPFIVAYNVISSIFRGAGDSRHPMYFVLIACLVNVVMDFVMVGGFGLGARGAAIATVLGQGVSVVVSLVMMCKMDLGISVSRRDIRWDTETVRKILSVGTPIAMQDGLIQVSFVVITVIANGRGLIDATAVGIVEKLIGFLFLVPSSFLSAISAITAQNMGAGKPQRARKSLGYGLLITMTWGVLCFLYSQFLPQTLVGILTRDGAVLAAGCLYLKSYAADTFFAAIHFCFSGYFCGNQKSAISFFHNILSIVLLRIPGSYLASKWWPDTLYPMGWAAPLGSILSGMICVAFFMYEIKREKRDKSE